MTTNTYAIEGGVEGRERLKLLSRVFGDATNSLLDRIQIPTGGTCLDLGCGGGDVTLELARRVGQQGHAYGFDIDDSVLDIARQEAAEQNADNVTFAQQDVSTSLIAEQCDVVHARFLLSHVMHRAEFVSRAFDALKPGGWIAIMDTEFRSHFSIPDSPAVHRYVQLYTDTVAAKGGEANIGPQLVGLLDQAGFVDIGFGVDHPTSSQTEVKLMNPVTLERIAPAVLAAGLASEDELKETVDVLYQQARDPAYIQAIPRVHMVWGRKLG